MKANRRALCFAVLVCVLIGPGIAVAQVAPVPTETAPAPAATTMPVASVLSVAPPDAWAVLGASNLQALDMDTVQLSAQLGFPIPFAPSPLLRKALGMVQAVDVSGIGVIVLDAGKFSQARTWTMFRDMPLPIVLAVASAEPKLLMQGLDAQPCEEPNIWIVTLKTDQKKQLVFAATKDGFVLFCPDLPVLKAVLAEGSTEGPASMKAALAPDVAKACSAADVFALINAKPIIATYLPMLKGMLWAAMMAAQAAQAQATQPGAVAGPSPAAALNAYLDVLASQMDKIILAADLNANGLNISTLATFQPDSLFGKVCASTEPTDKSLLAGLPAGQFIIAAGQQNFGQEYCKELTDTFSKPVQEALKASGEPTLVAMADKQANLAELSVKLAKQQKNNRFVVFRSPEGSAGRLAVAAAMHCEDSAKAWEILQEFAPVYVEVITAQQPKVKKVIDAIVYTADGETVDSVKVHNLLLDVSRLIEEFSLPEEDATILVSIVKTLLGPDGLKARIAVIDKDIVVTLGGGTEFLGQALAAVKSDEAPLSENPGIAKAIGRLPKRRLGEVYIALDALGELILGVVADVVGGEPPFKVHPIAVPIAISYSADKQAARVDLHVPIELAVAVKNMAMEVMMQQMAPPTGVAPGPGQPPPRMPAPDF